MRSIDLIVVHCAATRPGQDIGVAEIRKWHIGQGWSDIGYHYVIRLDGRVEHGRPLSKPGAHAKGFNARSVGVCLVGGCDKSGKAANTFSESQLAALEIMIRSLRKDFPAAMVLGHRDLPKVAKACPSFDVRSWCSENGIDPEPK